MLSPTQITPFMACPRKWYYEYVEKIPVPERFPLVRGAVVHSTLENFFRWRPAPGWTYEELIENMEDFARSLLKMEWSDARVTEKFGDDRFEETMDMIMRFLQRHKWKMDPIFERYGDPHKAWNFSKPKFRELHVIDHELGVQGYIDAVIERDMDELILIDYKTGSVFRHPVEEEHHRQLFIYALLFERNHGKRPAYVAVDYLLHGQVANYPVRDNFLDEVKDLIAYVHANTKSKDISDYEPNTGYKFCKWCDFREPCQGEPSLQK
jgi:CRISPR/Cas system-associated exonuclease Cas4 (RecB family)